MIRKNKTAPVEFRDNIESWAVTVMMIVAKGTKRINKARSLKGKHAAKVQMIIDITKNLPIGPKVCIYCQTYKLCSDCPYSRDHDCHAIKEGQDEFVAWIKKEYA